jgi:hypothetical protein
LIGAGRWLPPDPTQNSDDLVPIAGLGANRNGLRALI